MSTITRRSELHELVSTVLADALASDGWQPSTVPYDAFGSAESDELMHKSYAIGIGATQPHEDRQRQRRGEGLFLRSPIRIRYAYQLGALQQIESYRDALDVADDFVLAAARIQRTPVARILFQDEDHTVDGDGILRGELTLQAYHTMRLT